MGFLYHTIKAFHVGIKILILLWMVSIPFGCKPTTDASQRPEVVRKKIVANAKPTAKPGQPAVTQIPDTAKRPETKPAVADDKDKQSNRVDTEKKDGKQSAAPSESYDQVAVADRFPELYSPEGKIDPFLPPVKSKEEREQNKKKNTKRRTPRTPLEKIDISQMKLTAIIQSSKGNIGLIEESSGKGYVVSVGALIGLNGGKIKKILSDRLIIEEEAENVFGKMKVQEIEVRIFKPSGEL